MRYFCCYYLLIGLIVDIRRKYFIENMVDIGGMIVVMGIESLNKWVKMDSGLIVMNFDELKFVRYYRIDVVSFFISLYFVLVVSDILVYYLYLYMFVNFFFLYLYFCG